MKSLRAMSGLTLAAWCRLNGVSPDTWKSYECGRLRPPEKRIERARQVIKELEEIEKRSSQI